MKKRDKLSFLYHYVKGDVKEMFYKDKTKKTVCVLVYGWHVPSWCRDSSPDYGGAGRRIKQIAWNYFGLKVWVVTTSQKEYWEKIKSEINPSPADVYGITRMKKYKGKILKQKAKR